MLRCCVLVACLFMSGCELPFDDSDGGSTPCSMFGCHYDSVSDLGILFRDEAKQERITPAVVDAAYMSVSECFGLWFEPDIMLIVTDDLTYEDDIAYGTYTSKDGYTSVVHIRSGSVDGVIRHEFVHHYLRLSTGDSDHNHVSTMFDLCVYGA